MSERKKTSKKSASFKKSPKETATSTKIILDLINERYESNKDEPIDNQLKEEVKKTIKKFEFVNYLESENIIHTDKFIELICILLPKPMNGGDDDTLTKYEKARYFTFNKKYLVMDISAFAALIYAFILIYVAYCHFHNFYSDTDRVFDYNKILEADYKDLQIDKSSITAFLRYACRLIQNRFCSAGENIFKYIEDQILNLKDTTIKDVNINCFVNHDNSYYNFVLKGIQLLTSPTSINACTMETASYNLQLEINKKIHHLKLSNISVNDIYTYTYSAIQYGTFAIVYFKARLGILYCYAPQINKSNAKETLLLENSKNSKGGTRKRKTKNTRRNRPI